MAEPRPKKVYLAGPEVFLRDSVAVGENKKRLCARYGFEGLYPADNEVRPDGGGTRVDLLIYRANVRMIGIADFGILNLTPFRGPSADVGTVFELGMLTGLGKPAFAYTNDGEDLLDRVKEHLRDRVKPAAAARFDPATKSWRDAADMTIEDFGNADNLMIDATLAEQGRSLIRHQTTGEGRFRDLTGFEACLRLAAETFAPTARAQPE
jgi:nucleoside 2-deoxyribosyltransferase